MQIRTILLEFGNTRCIRLVGLAFLVIALTSSGTFALDPMGPSTTGLRQGEYDIGIDYSMSTMDIELTQGKFTELLNGSLNDSGEAESFKLKDFEMNKFYVNLGYGIWDYCDIFLRLGGVNTEFGDSIWEAGEEFDSGTNLSFCIGSRATFYEDGDLKIGRLIQLSWANMDGDLKAPQWAEADSVDMDLMEIQFAVGPTYTLAEGISIYGGPFFHFVGGNLEDNFSEASGGGLYTSKYSWEIEETSNFGGYFGIQIDNAEYTFFNLEYQHTSGANAIGLSIIWRF